MSGHPLRYGLQPVVIPASDAHRNEWVVYRDDGTVVFRHPVLERLKRPAEILIPPRHQIPLIRATFDDLNKALSRLANSPLLDDARSLRDAYEEELTRYDVAVSAASANGRWEPDYGSYVFDHHAERLYLVAPENWHRLGLVTSNSKLSTDPARRLSWQELRRKLEGAVIGFAGLSVGSNLLEGWLREARPRRVKVADPDWLELTNCNRCERASIRHLAGSRAERFDPKGQYETPRVAKVAFVAYEQNLVDPYLDFFVYEEPLNTRNARRFLMGNGDDEPAIDILVEEIDDLDMKVELRSLARQCGIDVVMVTDFGHRTQVLWNPFSENPNATLGAAADDDALQEALGRIKLGKREDVFRFVDRLCNFDYSGDPFELYVSGEGEHPTASLPQSGTTTMLAGGIGGKELVFRVLGHARGTSTRGVVFDFLNQRVIGK